LNLRQEYNGLPTTDLIQVAGEVGLRITGRYGFHLLKFNISVDQADYICSLLSAYALIPQSFANQSVSELSINMTNH